MEKPAAPKEMTIAEILAQNDAMLAASAKVNKKMDIM